MRCVSDEEMASYCGGLLLADKRALFESHLDECNSCSDAVALVVNQSIPKESTHAASTVDLQSMQLAIGEKVADYIIIEELGRGGMGIVYSAYDEELDREVALKVGVDRHPEEPLREARALAKLDDPHVVRVHKVLRHQGRRIIAMERIDGLSLEAWLREGPSKSEILAVLIGAGRGLAAAHQAGIVHSDIKPANIMVGTDGRARVTDFGLAQACGTDGQSGGGTPKYMAPEHGGSGVASERSDQYSFARTCAEALLGKKPPTVLGKTPKGVPASVWAALRKGCAEDPGQRHPDMEALLAAMHPKRSMGLLWVSLASALALGGGMVLAMNWGATASKASVVDCGAGEASMASVWNAEQRDSLRQRFGRSSLQSSGDTLARLEGAIDSYSAIWAKGYRDACEATHLRGEQSEQLLDARMQCLQLRRTNLSSFVQSLLESRAEEPLRASLGFFDRLPSPRDCGHTESLSAITPLPADITLREQIEDHQRSLSSLEADAARKPTELLPLLEELGPGVIELGYAPLSARYCHLLGNTFDVLGEYAKSEEQYDLAAKAAALAHDDVQLARTLNALMAAEGYRMGKIERGKAWAEAAALMMERADSSPEQRARFLHNEGMLLLTAGEFAKARETLLRAQDGLRRELGTGARELVSTLDGIGTSYYREGNLAKAAEYHKRSIKLGERAYGRLHQRLASPTNNLALVNMKLEKHEDAIEMFQRAREILSDNLGPESPQVGMVMVNMAIVFSNAGNAEKAEDAISTALPILEASLGREHPMFAETLSTQAMLASERGETAHAIEIQRQALSLREKLGETHPAVLTDHYNLAGLLCESEQYASAEKEWEFLDAHTTSLPAEAGWKSRLLVGRGGCELKKARRASCIALADAALKAASAPEDPEATALLAECRELGAGGNSGD